MALLETDSVNIFTQEEHFYSVQKTEIFSSVTETLTIESTGEERVEESVQEIVKESVQESVQKSVQKSVQVNVSENVSETLSEKFSQTLSQNLSENLHENFSENISETLSEKFSQTLSQNLSENLHENYSENVFETLSEKFSQTLSQNLSENLHENFSENYSETLSGNLSDEFSENRSETLSEKFSQTLFHKLSENLPENLSETLSQKLFENQSETQSQYLPENLSEKFFQNLSEKLSENLSKNPSQTLSQKLSENLSENLSETLSEKATSKINRVAHTWTIDSFSSLFDANSTAPWYIQSEKICSPMNEDYQFYLRLYPNGFMNNQKNLSIGIWNCNEDFPVVLNWRISILEYGDEGYSKEKSAKIDTNDGILFLDYVKRDFLLKNSVLSDSDRLTIYCEISFEANLSKTSKELLNCSRNNENIFNSSSHYDVSQKIVHRLEHKWSAKRLFGRFCIDSDIFETLIDNARFQFFLRLYPNGDFADLNSDQLCLYLFFTTNDVTSDVVVQYRLSLQYDSGRYDENHNDLFGKSKILLCHLADEKVTICCEVWLIKDRKIVDKNHFDNQSSINNLLDKQTTDL